MKATLKDRSLPSPRPGFTMVEILIVVVILGILAALVVPRFSNASTMARENTLREDLRYLRMQVLVYAAQHNDIPPGYLGGSRAGGATEAAFVAQMTQPTDALGEPGTERSDTYRFGPYLRQMPINPINGLSTVRIVGPGTFPGEALDTHGWIYQPSTLSIASDALGQTEEGVAYVDF